MHMVDVSGLGFGKIWKTLVSRGSAAEDMVALAGRDIVRCSAVPHVPFWAQRPVIPVTWLDPRPRDVRDIY
jgi:hypothetical protein